MIANWKRRTVGGVSWRELKNAVSGRSLRRRRVPFFDRVSVQCGLIVLVFALIALFSDR